jgi:hypothetical protein
MIFQNNINVILSIVNNCIGSVYREWTQQRWISINTKKQQ